MTANKKITAPVSERQVYHTGRLKSYPVAECWELMAASRPIFKSPGFEPHREPQAPKTRARKAAESKAPPTKDNVLRAVRRAKAKMRDYCYSTPFKWFVTLTLDPEKINRYDVGEIVRKMSQWCSDQVKRRGLTYVLVPELHKDGAVHFHGFFSDALEAVDSGTIIPAAGGRPIRPKSQAHRDKLLRDGGYIVYNLPGWKLGYTTAMELYGDYRKAVGYVLKYVGKELSADGTPRKIGGRWYYSGGKLRLPDVSYTDDYAGVVAHEGDAYVFEVPQAGLVVAVKTGNY